MKEEIKSEDKAWKMLLEALDNQQREIVRLQNREIELLKFVMELEAQRRCLTKAISEKVWEKDKEALLQQKIDELSEIDK